MKRFLNYVSYRFPFVPLLIYAVLLMISLYKQLEMSFTIVSIALHSLLYVGFLFHLRLLDESKDYEYDNEFHSDRPIQKGMISLSEIRIIAILNLFLLLSFVIYLNVEPLFIFIGTLLYSGLMFKEFWIRDFWERSSVMYLLSHEIVFVIFHYYLLSSIAHSYYAFRSIADVSFFIYGILPIIVIEIGRKMNHRYDSNNKKTTDTYAYRWGGKHTAFVFSALVILGFILYVAFAVEKNAWMLGVTSFALLLIASLRHEVLMKHNMLVTAAVSYLFPLVLLI